MDRLENAGFLPSEIRLAKQCGLDGKEVLEYSDPLYGQGTIQDPLVLELLGTPILQRLDGVDQAGYSRPFFPGAHHSRLEHSMGVFLLLRKHGAPFEEQVAGLIHDLSHSAFSHCMDYVLDAGSETTHSLQDDILESFVLKTEVPAILKRFDLDLSDVLEDKNHPLKERALPDLCADRIDYSLRSAIHVRVLSSSEVTHFLSDLKADNGQWVFKNREVARHFAGFFLHMNQKYYAGLETAIMFRTVGDCLRYCLSKGYVEESDLYETDAYVLGRIRLWLSSDRELFKLWKRMNHQVKVVHDPKRFDARVCCKSRVVDPLCYHENSIRRLSDLDSSWQGVVQRELEPKEYFLRFLD